MAKKKGNNQIYRYANRIIRHRSVSWKLTHRRCAWQHTYKRSICMYTFCFCSSPFGPFSRGLAVHLVVVRFSFRVSLIRSLIVKPPVFFCRLTHCLQQKIQSFPSPCCCCYYYHRHQHQMHSLKSKPVLSLPRALGVFEDLPFLIIDPSTNQPGIRLIFHSRGCNSS